MEGGERYLRSTLNGMKTECLNTGFLLPTLRFVRDTAWNWRKKYCYIFIYLYVMYVILNDDKSHYNGIMEISQVVT